MRTNLRHSQNLFKQTAERVHAQGILLTPQNRIGTASGVTGIKSSIFRVGSGGSGKTAFGEAMMGSWSMKKLDPETTKYQAFGGTIMGESTSDGAVKEVTIPAIYDAYTATQPNIGVDEINRQHNQQMISGVIDTRSGDMEPINSHVAPAEGVFVYATANPQDMDAETIVGLDNNLGWRFPIRLVSDHGVLSSDLDYQRYQQGKRLNINPHSSLPSAAERVAASREVDAAADMFYEGTDRHHAFMKQLEISLVRSGMLDLDVSDGRAAEQLRRAAIVFAIANGHGELDFSQSALATSMLAAAAPLTYGARVSLTDQARSTVETELRTDIDQHLEMVIVNKTIGRLGLKLMRRLYPSLDDTYQVPSLSDSKLHDLDAVATSLVA